MSSVPLLAVRQLCKSFRSKSGQSVLALDSISFSVSPGEVMALVGPDGAGKSTLIRIIAGLLTPGSGGVFFEGKPATAQKDIEDIQGQTGYMPQKFGLYEDLTVQENLDLYADLKNVPLNDREERYETLLAMSALKPFRTRLAGRLSGGMKQKLGLICTLISPPRLLLLDEPTVGVDPLSRRELWLIIEQLTRHSGMSVIVSTSYMDEAAKCANIVLLFEGKTLAAGPPELIRQQSEGMAWLAQPVPGDTPRALQARLLDVPGIIDAVPQGGAVRLVHGRLTNEQREHMTVAMREATVRTVSAQLEDSFMLLLRSFMAKREAVGSEASAVFDGPVPVPPASGFDASGFDASGSHASAPHARDASSKEGLGATCAVREPVIKTEHVSRRFGEFIAVNDVSFTVNRGEVFGLLGPNGAGKTTTFRMLCGLLPASSGTLHVAGVDVRHAREEARRRLGYVAQKFSLYGPLSVAENLDFFAGAYGLRGHAKERRIRQVIADFSLEHFAQMPAEQLPGGYKRRLAMAVGLLHEPAILFLDEPTSGADPLARREFWKRISRLADAGVTIVVTTHFMEEAEYCDTILIQDSGVMLALGTPAEIRAQAAPCRPNQVLPDSPDFPDQPDQSNLPDQPDLPDPSTLPPTMEAAFISIVERARAAQSGGTA